MKLLHLDQLEYCAKIKENLRIKGLEQNGPTHIKLQKYFENVDEERYLRSMESMIVLIMKMFKIYDEIINDQIKD